MLEDAVLSMLCYSMMAYGDSFRSRVYRRAAFVDCKKSGLQYYIGQSRTSALIAFRGTDSRKDLMHDLMFWKRELPSGCPRNIRVHTGFLKAYLDADVRETILNTVCGRGMARVHVTGHSLGAAIAILCALDLQSRGDAGRIECVVFGAPRVGNSAFASAYDSRVCETFRVENGNDAICKLPPAVFGYRHVGRTLCIGDTKLPFVYSMKDHPISAYLRRFICPCRGDARALSRFLGEGG